MTELEKKAYAYATDRQQDPNYPVYNWQIEINDAYEQGYKDAIDKACEWLNNFYNEDTHSYLVKEDIEGFRKAMEEQQ